MKYAIVKIGTTQLKISEGDVIKLLGNEQKPVFDVLFYSDGKKSFLDKNDLKEVKVNATYMASGRGRKLVVGRFKSKSRYDKTKGFRETFSKFTITDILFGDKAVKSEVVEKATVVKKPAKVAVTKKPAVKKVLVKKKVVKKA